MIQKRYIILLLPFFLMATTVLAQKGKNKNKGKETGPETAQVLTPQEVESISIYYDATTQKMLGNKKESLLLFIQCTQKDVTNAAAFYESAFLFDELKQPESALEYIKKAVELDPKNKWYLTLYADVLVKLEKIKDASKIMDQLIKLEPDNQDFLLQKADIHIYLKQYKQAIAIYDKLESRLGINSEVSLQKQKLYLAQGKYDAAENEMKKLVEAYPTSPEYYGMFGEFYLTINKKDKALKMYEKVLELDPKNPIIHLALASFYQENNEPAKAFEYIKLAFQNPDVDIDNKIKIMLSYYDLSASNTQRKAESSELLSILLQVHPDEPKAWSVKGDFDLRDGTHADAIADFEKVLEYDQGRYQIWDQLIKLYIEEENFDKVVPHSEKAIETFPSMPQFYYYAGLGCFEKNEFQKALDYFLTGKSLVVSDPGQKMIFSLGIAEARGGLQKYADAEKDYDNLVISTAEHPLVLVSYARYLLNKPGGDLSKAQTMVDKAIKEDSRDYDAWFVQAQIFYKQGNYTEAKLSIEKSIQNGGDIFARVLEQYGDILFKTGNVNGALEQWNKSLLARGKHSDQLNNKIALQKLD